MAAARDRVHATAIATEHGAVLIRGPSGAGKSDLALRCLSLSQSALYPHSVSLLADDQVLLERSEDTVVATPPQTLQGMLEVRGVGLVHLPASAPAPLRLVVDLVASEYLERLPEPATVDVLGVALPHLQIAPFEHSAPLKLLLALSRETTR